MALVKCIECGNEISDTIDSCIHCGCKNYKKIYNDYGIHENPSFLALARAMKLLLDVSNISGYDNGRNPEQEPRLWVKANYEFFEEHLSPEFVGTLSSHIAEDIAVYNDVCGLFRKEKEEREAKYLKEREEAATHSRCKSCGCVVTYRGACRKCNSTDLEIFKTRILTKDESRALGKAQDKLRYIMNLAFDEKMPAKGDRFSAIELCGMLNEKYNTTDFNKVIGSICWQMRMLTNAKYCFYEGFRNSAQYAEDGRKVDYCDYFFTEGDKNDVLKRYWNSTEEERQLMDTNSTEEIAKCIAIINEYQGSTYANSLEDIDFTYEQVKAAQVSYNSALDDFENKKAKEAQKDLMKQQIDEILSQPIERSYPNQVKGAKCPTCGAEAVVKIGTVKRAGGIALFGLLSKNIAKTMECKACGYKW